MATRYPYLLPWRPWLPYHCYDASRSFFTWRVIRQKAKIAIGIFDAFIRGRIKAIQHITSPLLTRWEFLYFAALIVLCCNFSGARDVHRCRDCTSRATGKWCSSMLMPVHVLPILASRSFYFFSHWGCRNNYDQAKNIPSWNKGLHYSFFYQPNVVMKAYFIAYILSTTKVSLICHNKEKSSQAVSCVIQFPANARRSPSARLMLAHRLRRWPSIKSALEKRLVLSLILLINLNFQPLGVVCRYRDPQLQLLITTHICLILDQTFANLDVWTVFLFPISVI